MASALEWSQDGPVHRSSASRTMREGRSRTRIARPCRGSGARVSPGLLCPHKPPISFRDALDTTRSSLTAEAGSSLDHAPPRPAPCPGLLRQRPMPPSGRVRAPIAGTMMSSSAVVTGSRARQWQLSSPSVPKRTTSPRAPAMRALAGQPRAKEKPRRTGAESASVLLVRPQPHWGRGVTGLRPCTAI